MEGWLGLGPNERYTLARARMAELGSGAAHERMTRGQPRRSVRSGLRVTLGGWLVRLGRWLLGDDQVGERPELMAGG